jgi:hypothetical protein
MATRGSHQPRSRPSREESAANLRDDIYNLETAARRCRVSKEQVLDWIDRGLRVFPLGDSMTYRARDYIILEEWLLDFFRSHGGVVRKAGTQDEKVVKPRGNQTKGRNRDQPLGPRPV